jgi:hypothetical protein
MTAVQFLETVSSPLSLTAATYLMGVSSSLAFASILVAALLSGLLALKSDSILSPQEREPEPRQRETVH